MKSDLVSLRPLTGVGLSLSDCSDLPIHQFDCDKALSKEGQPGPGEGTFCIHSTISPYKIFTSPYHQGEKGSPAELRELFLLDSNFELFKCLSDN